MSNRRAFVCLVLAVCVLSSLSFAVTPDRIAGAVDATNVVELKGHVFPMAAPQFDQGPVSASQTMQVNMLFMPTAQQKRALDTLLAEQQDPSSRNYHKWLTITEYAEQFGVSNNDIAKIKSWLEGQGFKVTYVAKGRNFLSFQGTAAQVSSTFRTQIHNYNVNGKMHFANATAPMIPAALSGIVGGFRGLHNFFPQSMAKKRPNFTFNIGSNSYAAIAPGDLAALYDINPLYNAGVDGTGQKIVIAGQSDVYIADINFFRGAFSLPTLSGCTLDSTNTILHAGTCTAGNFEVVWPNGNDPGLSPGDLGESDLDIETVSGVARGANTIFVTSGNGVDDSVSWAVDNQLAPVISYSYGLCEALVQAPSIAAAETEYKKASGLGITIFAASGDSASAICDGSFGNYPAVFGQSVSYPASSPEVTAVGGTEFDEGSGTYWGPSSSNDKYGTSALGPIPETGWNDTALTSGTGSPALDGAGGGPSNCAFGSGTTNVNVGGFLVPFEVCTAPTAGGFPKPSWQTGTGVPADSVRDVPDIAFSASNFNDPYIVCAPQSEVGGTSSTSTCAIGTGQAAIVNALVTYNSAFGGTSAPTPVAASMAVLLNQFLGTSGLGNMNTQLYTLFAGNSTSLAFNTIHSGTNSTTNGTSDNKVPCTANSPSFEPTALQCPSTGVIGYSVGAGYSQVAGLGSVDIYKLAQAWQASLSSFSVSAGSVSPTSVSAGTSATVTVTVAPTSGTPGTVTFSCPNAPSGISCTFNPTSVANGSGTTQLTINTQPYAAAATDSITVTGTSGSTSSSTTVGLTVTATTQTFTLAIQGGAPQVAQGATATVNITVTGQSGFTPANSPLTYNCTTTAPEARCIYPTSAQNTASVSVQITTTAPTGAANRSIRGSRIFYAALLPGLMGILFTVGSRKRTMRGMRMLGLIMVLGGSTLWLGSCGGSNGGGTKDPGTPPGSYSVTVSATTGGSVPVTGNSPFVFTLTVVQ